ncbi:branched-chain amino acid ABC transporter permease [Dactylosporangium sp. CA-092794]|uniref:branched-chain amino acid ABC transporter permease n=1 Tax=Dactylosporangium sp. CA-092794 TaxID=3239929 RepID=UPI003D8EA3AA
MSIFLQQVFNTLSSASVYALLAVGVTLVFGLTRIVNFAHGDLLTVGSYVLFLVAPGGAVWFLAGFTAAIVAVAVLAVVLERLLFRHTLVAPIRGFLVSLGLIQIIESGLSYAFTASPRTVHPAIDRVWTVGGVDMPADRVLVIVGTVAVFLALTYYLERTKAGLMIRAVAIDAETAGLMGAPVTRAIAGVFALGGMLAGAGGAFGALLAPVTPFLGYSLILKGFAVALIGGLGNVRGAVLGAIVLAALETIVITIGLSTWVSFLGFAMMIVLLVVRPRGLLRGVDAEI